MSTTNDIFLDSSILVEYERADRTELLDYLCERSEYDLFINETVLSEYAFQMLALYGQKAPLTLKVNGLISATLTQADLEPVLIQFTFLANSPTVVSIYLHFMAKYNLLPNDALILATCKLHNINRLASYDSDFAAACAGEGIQLIQTVADLAS
ncbi:MAG: PIN domain-containing protein [Cytophagaceae bacterium]|nr:MAG: PIN domain-containing protein [Cytophagaceae bacterium]